MQYDAINAKNLISDKYKDPTDCWYGIYKGILGFMVNTEELERLGLVTRTRSERDKRVYYLHINEQLRAEYRAYDQILYGALDELEARYTPQQVDLLCEMLDAINRGFQQAKTARALPGGKEKKGKCDMITQNLKYVQNGRMCCCCCN